jgi:hypothetical protein
MSDRMTLRIALGILVVTGLFVGVWAAVAPRSFFLDFPGFGHQWVATDGPYNEHLVRDVGALNLALATVTAGAALWLSRSLTVTAALAWLVYSVPHFAYHALNLQAVSADERVPTLVSLAIPIVLAGVVLLVAGPTGRDRTAAPDSPAGPGRRRLARRAPAR